MNPLAPPSSLVVKAKDIEMVCAEGDDSESCRILSRDNQDNDDDDENVATSPTAAPTASFWQWQCGTGRFITVFLIVVGTIVITMTTKSNVTSLFQREGSEGGDLSVDKEVDGDWTTTTSSPTSTSLVLSTKSQNSHAATSVPVTKSKPQQEPPITVQTPAGTTAPIQAAALPPLSAPISSASTPAPALDDDINNDVTAFINSITLTGRILVKPPPPHAVSKRTEWYAADQGLSIEERALQWLLYVDPMAPTLLPNSTANRLRLQQRYALRTLYVQQGNATRWTWAYGWDMGKDECLWDVFDCQELQVGPTENDIVNVVTKLNIGNTERKDVVGEVLSPELGLLIHLEHVTLTRLVGSLPLSIGAWSNLQSIHLSDSFLTGSIPATVGAWTNVSQVSWSGLALSGSLPSTIGNWHNVTQVFMSQNQLTGTLPEAMGAWTKLNYIMLFDNLLSGTIPSSIRRWSQLRASLTNNSFTGTVPHDICRFHRRDPGYTTFLYVDCPLLASCPCCKASDCPDESKVASTLSVNDSSLNQSRSDAIVKFINDNTLGNKMLTIDNREQDSSEARALQWIVKNDPLQLSPDSAANRFRLLQRYALRTLWEQQSSASSWTISRGWQTALDECEWFGVECAERENVGTQRSVIGLYLNDQNLNGTLSPELGLLSSMEFFDVSNSDPDIESTLHGTIPESLARWTNITGVKLGSNDFTGSLPSQVYQWSRLELLALQENSITGTLPVYVGNWTNMTFFSCAYNRLKGTIPDGISNWNNLMVAAFDGNDFTGTISERVCEAKYLSLLYADSFDCSCCQ